MQHGWELNNPNDSSSNPYQNSVDPTDPLTDPKYLQQIHNVIWNAKRPRKNRGHYLNAPPTIVTSETAQRVLAILRHGIVASGLRDWSQVKANLGDIAGEIRRVRKLAGESGPDPHPRSALFGGRQRARAGTGSAHLRWAP